MRLPQRGMRAPAPASARGLRPGGCARTHPVAVAGRAPARLSAAAALALAAVLGAGCATLMVTGAVDPGEAAREAMVVADAVREALRANGAVDSAGIRVSASGNVVTLTGSVPYARQRQEAERTSLRVSGVGRVVNRLTVEGA